MEYTTIKEISQFMEEGICIIDPENFIEFMNPVLASWLEINPKDAIGKSPYEYVEGENHALIQKTFLKDIGSSGKRIPIQILSSSGKKIPVLLYGFEDKDGRFLAIIQDNREIKTQDIIFKQLIQHMQEAVCITDNEGNSVYANPRLCYLLGRNFDEIVGFPASIWLDSKSQKLVEIVDKSERKKGISSTYPITIVTKLGNHIPVSLSGTPLPNGGTIGIMTDLREMKKREKSEKILYNAIQFSADGMIMCDTDGIIHFWNKGAQIIFGKKHDAIIWKHIEKILWSENSKTILDFKENINKFHLKVSLPNKTSIEISLTLTPIFEETGNLIISYLLVCRDITTRKKLEQELSLSHQKIKEAYKQFGKIKREQDYIFEFLEFARENSGNIEKVANYIVSSLLMISQTDACEVLKVNYDSWKLESLSHFWFGSEWDNKKQVEYKDSLTYTAYQHQSSMKYVDFMIEPKYINKSFARKLGFTSLMVIPLSDTKKCIGGISLYTKSDKKLEIFENDFIEKYIKIVELVLGSLL